MGYLKLFVKHINSVVSHLGPSLYSHASISLNKVETTMLKRDECLVHYRGQKCVFFSLFFVSFWYNVVVFIVFCVFSLILTPFFTLFPYRLSVSMVTLYLQ